jgi:hypothetical protein
VLSSGDLARTETGPISAVSEQDKRMLCSFCGKARDQVAGLALAPRVPERKTPATICPECLALCDEIIAEEFGVEPGEPV